MDARHLSSRHHHHSTAQCPPRPPHPFPSSHLCFTNCVCNCSDLAARAGRFCLALRCCARCTLQQRNVPRKSTEIAGPVRGLADMMAYGAPRTLQPAHKIRKTGTAQQTPSHLTSVILSASGPAGAWLPSLTLSPSTATPHVSCTSGSAGCDCRTRAWLWTHAAHAHAPCCIYSPHMQAHCKKAPITQHTLTSSSGRQPPLPTASELDVGAWTTATGPHALERVVPRVQLLLLLWAGGAMVAGMSCTQCEEGSVARSEEAGGTWVAAGALEGADTCSMHACALHLWASRKPNRQDRQRNPPAPSPMLRPGPSASAAGRKGCTRVKCSTHRPTRERGRGVRPATIQQSNWTPTWLFFWTF
jgi:hypothetical protein